MARKISAGSAGGAALAGFQAFTTTLTSASNTDIIVDPTGTGRFLINGNAQLQSQGDLRFADADSSNFVAFQAPDTVGANYTLTLPNAVASSAGFALLSDTGGNLSWEAVGVALTDNTSDSATNFITFATSTSGTLTAARVSSTGLTFQPSTGTFTCTNLSAGSITETSSIALKENISPINNALSSIMQLAGVTYDRKDGSAKNEAGLIAESVNQILPNLVTKDKFGNPVGINYTKFSAYLIEAVKSLKNEIDKLKKV